MNEKPECFGYYAPGETACEGEGGKDACGLLELCQRYTRHCQETSQDPAVLNLSLKQVIAMFAEAPNRPRGRPRKLVDALAPRRGRPPSKNKPAKRKPAKPTLRAYREMVKKLKTRAEEHLAESEKIIVHFEKSFMERYGERRFKTLSRSPLARPGMFYCVSNERQRYGSEHFWYCQAPGTEKDVRVVRIAPNAHNGTVDIFLPVTVEVLNSMLGEKLKEKLRPRPVLNSGWPTRLNRLDMERVGVVAALIKRLDERGIIKIPSMI